MRPAIALQNLVTLTTNSTPVFKLCFRSSGRFVGICDLGASAQQLAVDRRGSPVLLSLLLSVAVPRPIPRGS